MNDKIIFYSKPFPSVKSYKQMIDCAAEYGILAVECLNKFEFETPDISVAKELKSYADGKGIKFACFSLYVDLTSDDMKYDLRQTTTDGRRSIGFTYEFPPYKSWGINNNTKYAVILNHSGVCGSYSEAFKDICNKMDIPCEIVTGYTGMDHAWNVVMEDGVLKHIDIAYAIMNRNRQDKQNYFICFDTFRT